MTGNAALPAPVPALTVVEPAAEAWVAALAAAKNGGKQETATKNAARETVGGMFRKWGQYIEDVAAGDLEILLSSKFPLQRPRVPLGIQPPPANLRLKQGKASGYVAARCDPGPHRVIYEWQTAIGQNPTAWDDRPPTTAVSASFNSFVPGTWANVRVRARVPAGAGDWSSVIQIMVV